MLTASEPLVERPSWAPEEIARFLDIGAGVPTVGHVHEIAQSYSPLATSLREDARHGEEILADSEARN